MSQKNLLLLVSFFIKKYFFIKFAIKTVYTLPKTYNVTLSTTFVTILFCTNMLTIYSIYTTYNTETTTTLLPIQCKHY